MKIKKSSKTYVMTEDRKIAIAESFSKIHAHTYLNIKLTHKEFLYFEKGSYATAQEEKWNIFIVNNWICFARSWTDYCIFKVQFKKEENHVMLGKLKITRNKNEYGGSNIKDDVASFKIMLDFCTGKMQE